ncbi:MAG TPA: hypothetical protein VHZ76_00135 [Gammaproteobacteria bacterium]|jgi:hypothetical protein|nr:hypothetical protein [Gammaproteobacteria bacterium]
MSTCIKAGILGGIVLFIWSAVSWMALPWHEQTIHSFKDGQAVVNTMMANVSKSGIYFFPSIHPETTDSGLEIKQPPAASQAQEPMVFASIHLEGMQPMWLSMIIALAYSIVAACFVAWMLSKTAGLNYIGRVAFVVSFALAAALITSLAGWNWLRFDIQYTLVMIADMLIGWFLAGLVMAKVCKR